MEQRKDYRTSIEWSDAQRIYTRDERADSEEKRRAAAAYMSLETWQELQRQNELAHGDLTQRFLAARKGEYHAD